MNTPKIKILFFFLIALAQSCSDDTESSGKFVGAWVPYEIVMSDSTVKTGPFSGKSTFGFYAESLILNNNETYTPMVWYDKSEYYIRSDEGGDFQYDSNSNKILLVETYSTFYTKMEFIVVKNTRDELWLLATGDPVASIYPKSLYKLKRVFL